MNLPIKQIFSAILHTFIFAGVFFVFSYFVFGNNLFINIPVGLIAAFIGGYTGWKYADELLFNLPFIIILIVIYKFL